MFYLAGAAASSALDLIATLQSLTGNTTTAQSPAAFNPQSTSGISAAGGPAAGAGDAPASPLAPSTMNALLVVQGQNQPPLVDGDAFSQQLFSLLDSNGNGSISKSEFESTIGQNGKTAQADQIFAEIDTN